MFPLSFPYKVLSQAKTTDTVYDPFCGRGTTNYAARLMGLTSYGVDSNPVAHAIAQAKMIQVGPKEIYSLCMDILKENNFAATPQGEFWKLAYHSHTLQQMCSIRQYLCGKRRLNKVEIALRAILLGILHGPRMKIEPTYLSNQMPRTFSTKPDYSIKYWKKNGLKPVWLDVPKLVQKKALYTFTQQVPVRTGGKIVLGDSRTIQKITDKKFDWIVTSPPYWGMANYEQDQWLRNWFLGGSEKVDYATKRQLKHGSESAFVRDLSKVWSNVADKSKPGAKLIIRFGALPSKSGKLPSELIKKSLQLAGGWKVTTIRTAGIPIEAKRQANQFKNIMGGYIEEIDVFARLNT